MRNRRPQSRTLTLPLALLSAGFLLGCQGQGSDPVAPEGLGILLDQAGPHPHGGGGGDDATTFDVTIRTVSPGVVPWTTDGAQEVQAADSPNWLHVFDSGGNGTRGRAKYPGAFFTRIFFQPPFPDTPAGHTEAGCVGDSDLYDKFDQGPRPVVFDFQVGYDIADSSMGFSIFLFRWEDGGRIFSASTGFGSDDSDDPPTLVFLGDPVDIDDPTKTRVFEISGAKVIAQELNKKTVIAMLECRNDRTFEVTVAPHTP